MARTLSPDEARRYYERYASGQDRQGWYEDPALGRLLAGGDFAGASAVLEIGCGTGRFAEALVSRHLAPGALYLGLDIARAMVSLAASRLVTAQDAAVLLVQADATRVLPLADASVDRVVVAYVLDILSPEEICSLLGEARRVLRPGGRLCLASLTRRSGGISRLVAGLWSAIQRMAPRRVGGCRPVALAALVGAHGWKIVRHEQVAPFAVASEIVIARYD